MRIPLSTLLLVLSSTWPIQAQEVEDIRDVKGLITIPTPPNYWLWAAVAVVLIIAGYLLWKWMSRKVLPPGISAAKKAIEQLHAAERLINMDTAEPLVIKATDAIRNYIENRFSLAAPRQTTEEFLRNLREKSEQETRKVDSPELIVDSRETPHNYQLSTIDYQLLTDFLGCCDKVKFGRGDLVVQDRTALLDSARHFVEATRDELKVRSESGLSTINSKLSTR